MKTSSPSNSSSSSPKASRASTPGLDRFKSARFWAILVIAAALVGVIVACSEDDQLGRPDVDAGADVGAPSEGGADGGEAGASKLPSGKVDRAGRAAIREALLASGDGGSPDNYNKTAADTFIGGMTAAEIATEFATSLAALDLMDSTSDWDAGSRDAAAGGTLVSILRRDYLLIDSSKPFSATGYLEIESKALAGAPGTHTTCGGRWPADDAVDKTLSLIVKHSLTGVSDGVSAATKPPSLTFPYLAPPN